MKLIYTGKTKEVYELADGNYKLQFKDTATGRDGVFDPGENAVGLTIDGLGKESLALTSYFFNLLNSRNIPNHFISADLDEGSMTVTPAKTFGKGLEVVCRVLATGSFVKRYGEYVTEGAPLNGLVEFTIKNDGLGDPPITKDSLIALGIMTDDDFEACKSIIRKVASLINADLAAKGLTLYDMKLEFGKTDKGIIVVDEISGGCMRVYKGDTWLQPMELNSLILS